MKNYTYYTEITIPVEITYSYNHGEPIVRYYPDGSGHPGEPPSVTIFEINPEHPGIMGVGEDISPSLPDKLIEDIASEILENHDEEMS
jgi:hypothetical protein